MSLSNSSFLDKALALAAQDFRVFPLAVGGKLPAIGGWPQRATTDPEAIRKMWSSYDPVNEITYVREFNIGIATGAFRDGFITLIDVDVKNGAKGLESVETLDLLAPDDWRNGVMRVKTPSGGYHLYFFSKEPLGTTASKVALGIDTRGVGGFVVAAGSMVDGKAYELVGGEIKTMPAWLAAEIGAPRERADNSAGVICILDTQPALDRAIHWLRENAPQCEQGRRGSTAYRVAAAVKDFGVSGLACLELLMTDWNVSHCSPPMEPEDLAASVDHAYRYGVNPIGSLDPTSDFDEWNEETDPLLVAVSLPQVKRSRAALNYIFFKDVEPDLSAIDLVENWLEQGATSAVYGASNVGKTFVVMSGFAYSIATGTPWNGNAVTQGAVLYIAAEAGFSAKKRIKALKLHYGREDVPLALVPSPVDLLRPAGDCKAIIDLAKRLEAETGMKVVLIVIDTLSRALAGGDENGPVDMGSFIMNVDQIRAQTNAHMMLIHHSGKNEALGARGWSGLRAAVDTEIEVTEGVIRGTKQRDIEAQPPVSFRLQNVPIGRKPNGTPVTSAVAVFGEIDDTFDDFCPEDISKVQAKIATGTWFQSSQSTAWAGVAVAQAFGWDADDKDTRPKITVLLKRWLQDGFLRVGSAHDGRTGRDRPVVLVGERA